MSIFDKVETGRKEAPFRLLVTGIPGIGKSTFASGAPRPLFLDCERRTEHLDVARLQPPGWAEILDSMRALVKAAQAGECPYKTLVVDTLDHAELKLWKFLCDKHRCESIEDIGGGFGKGYIAAKEQWRTFMTGVEALRDVGMNIILVAHAEVKTVNNPEGENYDSWVIKLNRHAAGIITEKMDAAGFAKWDDLAQKKRGELKAKALSSGERVLCFGHSPAYYTKPGMGLPDTMPLDWETFAKEMKA